MGSIASERFIGTNVVGAWEEWICPAGKRAVVKCVIFTNLATTSADVAAVVAGSYVHQAHLPAQSTSVGTGLYATLYANETVMAYNGSGQGSVLIAGFLFDDPLGNTLSSAPADLPGHHLAALELRP